MKYIVKLLSLVALSSLATLSVTAQQPQQKPAPKKANYELIPVFADDTGSYLFTMVELDGKEYPFIIDTGAGYSVIVSKHIAKALGKDLKNAGEANGVAGTTVAHKAEFKSFIIGKRFQIPNINADIIPLGHLKFKAGGKEIIPAGLIGSPLLSSMKCIIDYGKQRILVPPSTVDNEHYTRSRKNQGDIPLTLKKGKDGYPFIDISIQGKTLSFLIDTAAAGSVIEPSVAKAMKLKIQDQENTVTGAGGDKSEAAKSTIIIKPIIGSKVQLPQMFFYILNTKAAKKAPAGANYGGIFGSHRLKTLKATLDYGSYTLLIPKAQLQSQNQNQ